MLVVLVVGMRVLMDELLVPVLMLVVLGEVQPEPDRHQHGG